MTNDILVVASSSGHLSTAYMIVEVLAGVFGLSALISVLVTYIKGNVAKNTISLQSEQIRAQAQRIATLKDDLEEQKKDYAGTVARYEEQIATLHKRLDKLQAQLEAISNIKSGADAIVALEAKLGTYFQQTLNGQDEILTKLNES